MKTTLFPIRPRVAAAPAAAVSLVLALALALPGVAAASPRHGEGHSHAAHAEQPAAGAGLEAKAAFERVKKLAGEWQGTIMTPDGAATTSRFEVTAGGHAVLEKMFAGTGHEMVNVYHLDGGDLVVTHYCSAGNQPRMRYAAAKSGPDLLVFDFAGGSSFDPGKDMHIHEARIVLQGEDRLESEWGAFEGGKAAGTNKLYLARRK